MQAKKIGTASALLIATLAVAFVPTAAAEDIVSCTDKLDDNPPPESITDVAGCEEAVLTHCLLGEVPDEDRAFCLVGQ